MMLLTKVMGQFGPWIGLWDLIVTAPAAVKSSCQGEREPGGYVLCIVLVLYSDILGQKEFVCLLILISHILFQTFPWPIRSQDAAAMKKTGRLMNGRLAMMAAGIATQSVLTGHSSHYV
jgi:hypothetical protein